MITDNLIINPIKRALEDYRLTTDNMEGDGKAKVVREEIDSLQERLTDLLRELEEINKPYKIKLSEIEEYIKAHALEIATSFEHMGVKVSYRKGYERITWTSKEMDSICLKNPALLSVLAPARKVTLVDPRVSIAVLEVDTGSKESS